MPKLDHNLVFGERHNMPDIRAFLNSHMQDFYERGYRVLICEINGALKLGDLIVEGFPKGSTLQDAVDHVLDLVRKEDESADVLLENIRKDIPNLSALGVEREQFGLLLKRALENKIRLYFVDYVEGQWEPGLVRTKSYNDHASPLLRALKEKWLELTGDDHVDSVEGAVGIVQQVGHNVVGFRYQDVMDALRAGTLRTIEDLEQVPSITSNDERSEEEPVDEVASLRAMLYGHQIESLNESESGSEEDHSAEGDNSTEE